MSMSNVSLTLLDSAQLSATQLGKHYPSKGFSMMNLTKLAYNLESYSNFWSGKSFFSTKSVQPIAF